jgi:hypothetical protein
MQRVSLNIQFPVVLIWVRVRVMVFNTNFNNITVIPWQSVLLVEETGGPGENHKTKTNKTKNTTQYDFFF